jgi:hypothetical protein
MTTTAMPAQDGLHPDVPEDVYHADRGSLSFSGAKLLLPPSCPAKFREHMDNPPKPKREYTFGHAAHKLVLGKGAEIVEVDAPDWRSKAAREIRDQASNSLAPMLTCELEKARAIATAVHQHPTAGPFFTQGDAEMSLYATDPKTGIRLRGRPDWLTTIDGQLWIIDFKTSDTANPNQFARKGAGYFYHGQHAWYQDLIKAAGLSPSPRFIDIVCEKTPPYVVTVVEFDTDAVTEGRRLNRQAINIYADCVRTNTWPDYGPGIHPISLPLWAFDNEEMVIP